jgi:hypothetical protein
MGETTQDLTHPARPLIASLDDVRPGDLIFTAISEPLAASVLVKLGMLALAERVRIGRRSFDHVIVVTEAAKYVDDGPAFTYVEGPLHDRPRRQRLRGPVGVQAMPRGAERVELTAAKHWNDRTAVVRIPESYDGQALDVAEIAKLFAREQVPYSFATYVQLAAWRFGWKTPRLEARIDRRMPATRVYLPGRGYAVAVRLPAEAICSGLGDQAWTLTGRKIVEGVAKQAVTPGRLVMTLWRFPGAIWGGPGILG